MFCPNCGRKINDSSSFCPECGWKKNKSKIKSLYFSKIPKKYLCIVGILFVVVASFTLFRLKGKVYSFKDITKAKLVTEYNNNTTIEMMDSVKFGSYPQSDKEGNKKDDIEWIVLDRQDNKALLLSKYILYHERYHIEGKKDIVWEGCYLRYWLNDTFYNTAFDSNEQSKILTTNVINNDDTDYNTKGGNNTYDKIFCLSSDEVVKYFALSNVDDNDGHKRLATKGTNYAKNVGKEFTFGDVVYLSVYDALTLWYNGNSDFWLRSPGSFQNYAAGVDGRGCRTYQWAADSCFTGVRPALWVDISSLNTKNNVSNGWDGDYYYIDGKKIINDWIQYNNKWYYLDTDGKYVRGDWKQVGNDLYYFDSNGGMLSNEWVDGKYYVDSNGKMLKDTITPDGYYVDVNGEYNENSMYSYVP